MDSALFWQNPFVNVAKVFKIGPESGAPGIKKNTKKGITFGDVKEKTCHDIRATIWVSGILDQI